MQTLAFNFILYFAFFALALRAGRKLTIYNVSVLWFTVIAFFGVYSYGVGAYSEIFWNTGRFHTEPYLLCFASIVLLLEPWRKFNESVQIESLSVLDLNRVKMLMKFLLVANIVLTAIYSMKFAETIFSGRTLADLYNEYHEEGSAALKYSNLESKAIWILSPFRISFYWFLIIVSVLQINRSGRDAKFWLACIVFAIAPDLLIYAIRSARGEILYMVVKYAIFFVLIWPYVKPSLRKRIISFSAVIIGLFAVYTISISVSRFDDSSQKSSSSIIRYMGEAYPNLSNQLWDKVLVHPMGTRMMPYITGDITGNDVVSVLDQHEFWEYITGVPMLNFKTIYGDFYIEFGKIGGFAAMMILSLFFLIVFRKKTMCLYLFPMYTVYVNVISIAPLFFAYRGRSQFYNFLWCVCATLFIKHSLYKGGRAVSA